MKLKLLDIPKEIQKNKLLEVKNANLPTGTKYDPEGLWSEEIFGKVGGRERKNRFGYVDLKDKIFHPQIYDLIKTVSEPTSKIMSRKARYKIVDGKLIPDANGGTGLAFLIDNLDKIDLRKIAKKEKVSEAAYLEKNKSKILIDKWLIVPPGGLRDIDMSRKDAARAAFSQSEINNFYKGLLYTILQLDIAKEDPELRDNIIEKVQKVLVQISTWIKQNLMKGKGGLFRGSMLKKTMDFSTRIILASSPSTKLGEIGMPWHTLMKIYEPLVSYHVYTKDTEKKVLGTINNILGREEDNMIDHNEFNKLLQSWGSAPEQIDPQLETLLKDIIREICKTATVIVKRDPVLGRRSWFAATPVITEGRVAVLNSMDLGPLGGDCDGDTVAVTPLFTNQAKEVANKNMNPAKTKAKWFNSNQYGKTVYNLDLDAVASVYAATKDA
jgi:DNA-directed RNA polymerase beta' subunit